MRFLLTTCLLICTSASLADVAGSARVIDGDTLVIGETHIRLHGIDAPEADQDCRTTLGFPFSCGDVATTALRDMTAGQTVGCKALDQDRYGRTVARCHVGRRDIGQQMVRDGMAIAFRRYALDYVSDEQRAKATGAGFWSANMQAPADYRAAKAEATAAANTALAGTCDIKGNISSNGRIYHVPGQEFYDRTRISEGRGERWFCSKAAAEAAGWRAARR